MNYLLPVTKFLFNEKKNFDNKDIIEDIVTQQIIISQLSNGITFEDTNNMDTYERVFVFKKLIQMKKEENDAKMKAIENAKKNI